MNKIILLLILNAAIIFKVGAADMRTQVFHPDFRTLQVQLDDNEFFPPIINLDGGQRLLFSFDELADDMRYMRYKVVHCNSDWQPSQLVDSEFVNGFNEASIEDYEFSSGTFINYVHYRFALPNDQIQMTVSGNYVVQVYDENSPDEILLQARFMVSENKFGVYPGVTSRTDIDYNDAHQQLEVRVSSKQNDKNRIDWHNDIKLVLMQNMRTDNAVTISRPSLIESEAVVYQHMPQLIFPAGNEYRRFEAVTVRYAGINVSDISHYDPYYHVTLFTDISRAHEPYLFDQTQYGRFKVRQSDVLDSDCNAEYVIVHFSLDTPQMHGGDFYIDGEFTHHNFDRSNKMNYNPATGLYEREMIVKMGSYNYQYLWLPNDSQRAFTAPAEGDKYQTVNEYLGCVYRRSPGERYDRLMGFGIVYSGK